MNPPERWITSNPFHISAWKMNRKIAIRYLVFLFRRRRRLCLPASTHMYSVTICMQNGTGNYNVLPLCVQWDEEMERVVLGHKLEIDPIANHFHIIVSLGRARIFPIIQNNEKKSYSKPPLFCLTHLPWDGAGWCVWFVPADTRDGAASGRWNCRWGGWSHSGRKFVAAEINVFIQSLFLSVTVKQTLPWALQQLRPS